jgi:hypothetical protein
MIKSFSKMTEEMSEKRDLSFTDHDKIDFAFVVVCVVFNSKKKGIWWNSFGGTGHAVSVASFGLDKALTHPVSFRSWHTGCFRSNQQKPHLEFCGTPQPWRCRALAWPVGGRSKPMTNATEPVFFSFNVFFRHGKTPKPKPKGQKRKKGAGRSSLLCGLFCVALYPRQV